MINPERIPFLKVLKEIGFEQLSEYQLQYDFGNCVIKATESLFNVLFSGSYVNARSAAFIEHYAPTRVDSYEQGVALAAYYLRNYDFQIKPEWLKQGLEWADELPWRKESAERARKEKERREFEVRFDYDLFKVLVKKLKVWYENRDSYPTIQFSFDGEIMRIQSSKDSILVGGKGKAWTNTAVIETNELEKLPKRILRHYAEVILHKEDLYLCFGKYRNIEYSNNW
jgi:hypothetical protein